MIAGEIFNLDTVPSSRSQGEMGLIGPGSAEVAAARLTWGSNRVIRPWPWPETLQGVGTTGGELSGDRPETFTGLFTADKADAADGWPRRTRPPGTERTQLAEAGQRRTSRLRAPCQLLSLIPIADPRGGSVSRDGRPPCVGAVHYVGEKSRPQRAGRAHPTRGAIVDTGCGLQSVRQLGAARPA